MRKVIGVTLIAAGLLFAAKAAYAVSVEIKPTAEMMAKARKVLPPEGEHTDYYFRKSGLATMVCAYYGGNGGFCGPVSLADIKKLDARVADFCQHDDEQGVVPHALTGEGIFLNYRCVHRRMKRDPYATVFDQDGYRFEEWKFLD